MAETVEATSSTIAPELHFDPPLDDGIRDIVLTLMAAGIETRESCQGAPTEVAAVLLRI
jgi:hypothetical protein